MKIYLVDGTYELFRAYFALPSRMTPDGRPVGAVWGLIRTLISLLRQGNVTHIACAYDHVIESFRNNLFTGYKTGAGVPEDLVSQFKLAEKATSALGIVVWPMIEFEADDAIASWVAQWRNSPEIDQIVICSPDKDLMQLVRDERIVCLDRRRKKLFDESMVREKFGIVPSSIPDYLALVGDSADGIPGIPRWGPKSSAMVLNRYCHIAEIPDYAGDWSVTVRGADVLASNLAEQRKNAMLYKDLATLRMDVPIDETVKDLLWQGVRFQEFLSLCDELGLPDLVKSPHIWA